MANSEILIIGAGAAGLMAALTLAKAGRQVTVLEARNRCGGRIHTIDNQSFFTHGELGAEFVHGDLPVTLGLLREAGIPLLTANGEMWHYENGQINNEGIFMEDWGLLIKCLNKLEEDISINDFMRKEFPEDKYSDLRNAVWNFVAGYETADPRIASCFALRKEWQSDDNEQQYRITGGYGAMIKYMEGECKRNKASIWLNSVVREIHWQAGNVKAITTDGTVYEAGKIIIALPLGVLQANEEKKGTFSFYPPIGEQSNALMKMGFGAVIKVLFQFDDFFWEEKVTSELVGKDLKNMGYLFSGEEIPTWWTQFPRKNPVLTGWLGGPGALERKYAPVAEILQQALQSLGNILKRNPEDLKNKLIAFNIINWTDDPFTCGSYAYDTVASPAARKVLNTPVYDTLFFAGEYLYDGPAMGTVEAALKSGKDTAAKMLKML